MGDSLLQTVSDSIFKKTNMRIEAMNPAEAGASVSAPTILIASLKDDIIMHTHSEQIFRTLRGKKKIIIVEEGGHNSERPQHVMEYIRYFIRAQFGI